MAQLEDSIRATEEAALDAAETDSVITGTSFTGNADGRSHDIVGSMTQGCMYRQYDMCRC